ncbi:MAG: hypothetical protein ACYC5X_06740 [Syntrophales bacterium]
MVQYILWSLCLLGLLLPCSAAGHENLTPGDLEAGAIGLEEKNRSTPPAGYYLRRDSAYYCSSIESASERISRGLPRGKRAKTEWFVPS